MIRVVCEDGHVTENNLETKPQDFGSAVPGGPLWRCKHKDSEGKTCGKAALKDGITHVPGYKVGA